MFGRRRGAPEPVEAPAPDETAEPPRPTAPPGRPEVRFLGVLDGRHLWVAVDAVPGRLALRAAGGGNVVELEAAPESEQPGWLSARLDLTPLAVGSEHELVLVRPGQRETVLLWALPLPEVAGAGARRVPVDDVRGVRHGLRRRGDGAVVISTAAVEPAALLESAVAERGRATLRLTPPPGDAGATPALRMLTTGDEPTELGRWTTETDAGVLVVEIPLDTLDGVEPQKVRFVLGDDAVPVRRARNDLADGLGAPLPPVFDLDDQVRIRLRWSPDGADLLGRVRAGGDA